jgi:hypothetical protein
MNDYAQIALERATASTSMMNYGRIMAGFQSKGLPAEEIHPRVNVLTLQAWNAKGRRVKRYETGVKILTWVNMKAKDGTEYKRPKNVAVFHISQTEPART